MMDVRYVPDRDEAGRVRGLFSLVTDVTEKRLGEQELSRSRDRLDAIVSTAADAIITLDRNGIIESFNRAAESMFGYAADEIVGADVRQLLEIPEASPPPSLERPSRWGALADPELGQAREADGHRKDGTSFPVEVAVSEIGGGEAFTAIARDIELRKRYREELLRSREALRSLSARLITAEENERRRISLELHDDFSQRLAMLAVDVEHLAGSRGDEEARRRLEAVGRSLADLTDDMHRLAYTLHPSMLDHLGLAAALRRHLEDLSARHPLEVVLSERGFGTDLGTEAASCLYRVAQESLSNVVKHSGGRRVTVRLSGTPQAVRLTIRDMGKGFDVEAARQRQTLGLTSMEERIRLLGGTFSLRSRPGTGTVVQATCPRRPPHR
jgi:PAS domain S-box-containing protein